MTGAKKYHLETLRFLMGSARRDDLLPGWRFDMIGRPQEVQADGDEGLALLDVRPDGVYVKAMEDDKGHRSVEISFLTGDNGGRRHSGLPLLPIPFTVDDLRRVQGGALGIVEGLSCGDETNARLAQLGFLDPDAEEVARALMDAQEPTGDDGAPSVGHSQEQTPPASKADDLSNDTHRQNAEDSPLDHANVGRGHGVEPNKPKSLQNTTTERPKPKRRKKIGWKDYVWPYMIRVFRAGKFASMKELYNHMYSKAGEEGSPFSKGSGDHHRGKLFVDALHQSLSLKTLQNEWGKLREDAAAPASLAVPSVPPGN